MRTSSLLPCLKTNLLLLRPFVSTKQLTEHSWQLIASRKIMKNEHILESDTESRESQTIAIHNYQHNICLMMMMMNFFHSIIKISSRMSKFLLCRSCHKSFR